MSISESYEFENQLTNRLGKRTIQNEEEIKADLEVKKLQEEILRETTMIEEQKVEDDLVHPEDKNSDKLSFNSEVEVEETSSDEGEPGVFNFDNMAE